MAYGDFEDFPKRVASDKILRNKALILLKIQNAIVIKKVILQWFINFLIRILLVVMLKVKLWQTKS